MNATKDQLENTAIINYIVYELNDSALLLNCTIRKNNKSYFSNIPISIFQFSELILTLNDHQYILKRISESLFNKDLLINHVSPASLFNKQISVKIDDLFSMSNQLKATA
jgi:hypothetical protein